MNITPQKSNTHSDCNIKDSILFISAVKKGFCNPPPSMNHTQSRSYHKGGGGGGSSGTGWCMWRDLHVVDPEEEEDDGESSDGLRLRCEIGEVEGDHPERELPAHDDELPV